MIIIITSQYSGSDLLADTVDNMNYNLPYIIPHYTTALHNPTGRGSYLGTNRHCVRPQLYGHSIDVTGR